MVISEVQVRAALACLPQLRIWTISEQHLDRFFAEHYGTFEEHDVTVALAVVDVLYSSRVWSSEAGPERFFQMVAAITAFGPDLHESIVAAGLLHKHLGDLSIGELGILLNGFHKVAYRQGSRDKEVAASKYLHFCYPRLYPIQDREVKMLLWGNREAEARHYSDLLDWYHAALTSPEEEWSWTYAIRECTSTGRHFTTPVRTMDSVLWLIARARTHQAQRQTPNGSQVNREVREFLSQPENELLLRDLTS